jgi:23S rRNA pseudouridine1911/1915/1917 synthase
MTDYRKYFEVVYEDNHLIGVNKKGGVLVQGDETGDIPLSELVKEYIREKYQKPGNVFTGVIHRLDRPVSGLVVLAKTSKALERMNELFREKDLQKTYIAIVGRRPDPTDGTLINWLIKDNSRNITSAYNSDKRGGQKAELHYDLISSINDDYMLKVNPVTGRPHQIRAQLSNLGCPINGDVKYGSRNAAFENTIALHSYSLEFIHPVKKEPIVIKAGLPDNILWSKFKGIKFDF